MPGLSMQAMVLRAVREPLEEAVLPAPEPGPQQVLIRVHACGVCRTDLHVADGELPQPKLPLILGHQIVGTVVARGSGVSRHTPGSRVGVPWLGWTCGQCRHCGRGQENLCERALFTGYTLDGGFADFAVADQRFAFGMDEDLPAVETAPLLCAGLIGYRALRLAGDAETIGFYGFGAAAHILIQVCRHLGRQVFAFTRPGDEASQAFARRLGAAWAGSSRDRAPLPLDAAIIFAPAGELVPLALRSVVRGGVVVCAGIHMSDIPAFPYADLWHERVIRSVANLTRRDADEFLDLAPRIPVMTEVTPFALREASAALTALRDGRLNGAAVLVMGG